MPFPAVSVGQVAAADYLDPWENFARLALDRATFDCFIGDTDCLDASTSIRRDFAVAIDSVITDAVDTVVRKGRGSSAWEPFDHALLCHLVIKFFGVEGYRRAPAFAEALRGGDGAENSTLDDLKGLAASIFRKPLRLAISDMDRFISVHITNYTLSYYCPSYFSQVDYDVALKVFALFKSLGSKDPQVPLGQFLSDLMADPWGYLDGEDVSFMAGSLAPLYKFLSPKGREGEDLQASKLRTYLLGEKAYGGMMNHLIFHKMPDLEDCPVLVSINTHGPRQGEFCEADGACCKLQENVTLHYEDVLRIMKFSIPPSSWSGWGGGDAEDVERALSSLDYSYSPVRNVSSRNPIIYAGVLNGVEDGGEVIQPRFRRFFSNVGVSFTFNADPFWKIFRKSRSLRAFHREMVEAAAGTAEDESHLFHPVANGPLFSLELHIRTPESGRTMTIHPPSDLPDLVNEPIEIYPGNTYSVLVTPWVTLADTAVREMDPERSKCQSSSSNGPQLRLFRQYSKSLCMFECKLERAARHCGCVPWSYPRIDDEAPVCHFKAQLCFEAEMSRGLAPSRDHHNSKKPPLSLSYELSRWIYGKSSYQFGQLCIYVVHTHSLYC